MPAQATRNNENVCNRARKSFNSGTNLVWVSQDAKSHLLKSTHPLPLPVIIIERTGSAHVCTPSSQRRRQFLFHFGVPKLAEIVYSDIFGRFQKKSNQCKSVSSSDDLWRACAHKAARSNARWHYQSSDPRRRLDCDGTTFGQLPNWQRIWTGASI